MRDGAFAGRAGGSLLFGGGATSIFRFCVYCGGGGHFRLGGLLWRQDYLRLGSQGWWNNAPGIEAGHWRRTCLDCAAYYEVVGIALNFANAIQERFVILILLDTQAIGTLLINSIAVDDALVLLFVSLLPDLVYAYKHLDFALIGVLGGHIEVKSVLLVLHEYEVNLVERFGSLFAIFTCLGPVFVIRIIFLEYLFWQFFLVSCLYFRERVVESV